MPGKVDLHLHSTESDGRLSPTRLLELAERNGVRRLALTDHDTTQGLAEAFEAGRQLGVEVFPGIELSTDIPGTEVHVLGLFLRHEDTAFQQKLAEFRAGRLGRAEQMVAKLGELGVPIAWERVLELAGTASVGRPHVAQALLEAGHVKSMPEAFDRFIGRNGPAYAERAKLTPAEAVALIHSVSGMAVLAHPLETEGVEAIIPELARDGLDGVECYYQGYDQPKVQHLVALARSFGLVPTGGSDFHGFPMSGMTEARNEPGTVEIPPEVVDELFERRRAKFGR
jgi:predicted metal-dependent phosphoesterase TrpH